MTVWARRRKFAGGLVVFAIITLLGVLAFSLLSKTSAPDARRPSVVLAGKAFSIDIVSTAESKAQGLSGRQSLGRNEGMLFVYDKPDQSCFWMKDMNFDIDILWFDQNKKLIDKKVSATPASYPESFCSSAPAQFVLEVPAGTAEQLKLKLGDALDLKQ